MGIWNVFFCGQADCPRFLRRPVLFVDEIVGRRCFSPGDERFVALKSRGGSRGDLPAVGKLPIPFPSGMRETGARNDKKNVISPSCRESAASLYARGAGIFGARFKDGVTQGPCLLSVSLWRRSRLGIALDRKLRRLLLSLRTAFPIFVTNSIYGIENFAYGRLAFGSDVLFL